ncbi:MAG: hypothetical protein KC635_25815 [Myxococcales bacterium]|nr:hypothetical protein [Myxococcales bacterium]MCB9736497.1 hypothetical protein [Deltaproteobacteria bacterium]
MTPLKLAPALLLLVSVLALAPGCGSSPPTRDDDAATTYYADPPFPAAALRDGIHPGQTYLFKITAVGSPEHRLRMRFLETGAEGAVMERAEWPATAQGPGESVMGEATWEELESHARYAKENTVVTDSEVTVPAGHFATRLYTVTTTDDEGHTEITRAHFAPAIPGPPVLTEISSDGDIMMTMTLLSFEPGEAAKTP